MRNRKNGKSRRAGEILAAVFLTAFLTAPFVLGCPKSVWAAQKASAWENEEETGPEEDDGLPGLLEIEEELAQLLCDSHRIKDQMSEVTGLSH